MNPSSSKKSLPPTGVERRQTRRRSILETFSVFLVIPRKGIHKLRIQDVSEDGLGFDLDVEGESFADFPVQVHDVIALRFYLNQSLYIPLSVEIVRIEEQTTLRHVGSKFNDKTTPDYKTFLSLLELLDRFSESPVLDT